MLLDVDDTALKRRLLITGEAAEVESESVLPRLATSIPVRDDSEVSYRLVTPTPGKCFKYKDEESAKKYFLNLCHTDVIPPPEDLSEKELADLIYTDSVDSFKLPLSSGETHEEKDKGGNTCQVFDIAVNSQLFAKIVTEPLFSMFFLHVASTVLEEKYGLHFDPNAWIPLNNRKSVGKIRSHKIEFRDKNPLVKEVPRVERVQNEVRASLIEPLITEVATTKLTTEVKSSDPKYTVALEEIHGQQFVKAVFELAEKVEHSTVDIVENLIRVTNPRTATNILVDIQKKTDFKVWNRITSDACAVANKEAQVLTFLARLEKA